MELTQFVKVVIRGAKHVMGLQSLIVSLVILLKIGHYKDLLVNALLVITNIIQLAMSATIVV